MKHKLLMVGGIALVVVAVIVIMKKGLLKDVPGVGQFLTL